MIHILKVRMARPGYPTLQERTVRIPVRVDEDAEVMDLRRRGFQITKTEVE